MLLFTKLFSYKQYIIVQYIIVQYIIALIFQQRYYGTSLPFGEASFSKENIGFLSIEQALADYAVLLKSLQISYKAEDCKVVTFGGRYSQLFIICLLYVVVVLAVLMSFVIILNYEDCIPYLIDSISSESIVTMNEYL